MGNVHRRMCHSLVGRQGVVLVAPYDVDDEADGEDGEAGEDAVEESLPVRVLRGPRLHLQTGGAGGRSTCRADWFHRVKVPMVSHLVEDMKDGSLTSGRPWVEHQLGA